MIRSRSVRAIPLAVAMSLACALALAAQEPMQVDSVSDPAALVDREAARLDAQSAEIAAQLRCPVCTGQSVLESNSGIAQEMQAVIRERLAGGDSEEEVLDYFVASYGDWIILKPRARGWNLLVYVLPGVVLLGGAVLLVRRLRTWSRAAEPVEGEPVGIAAGAPDTPIRDAGLAPEDEAWLRETIGQG